MLGAKFKSSRRLGQVRRDLAVGDLAEQRGEAVARVRQLVGRGGGVDGGRLREIITTII